MSNYNPCKVRFFSFIVSTALCCLTGASCSRPLSVRTDYLSKESLASYHVGTPDPLLCCPPTGERLVVSWSLETLPQENTLLEVNIRLRNRAYVQQQLPVYEKQGSYIYNLLNQDYDETGGIQSYYIRLLSGDCVIDEWKHLIWAELIELDVEECWWDEDEEEELDECDCDAMLYDQAIE